MQQSTKKSNSFNTFLDTVRQLNPPADYGGAAQQRILLELAKRGSVPFAELAKITGLPPMEGIELVEKMVGAALLVKNPSASDGMDVQLTPQGKEVALVYMAG